MYAAPLFSARETEAILAISQRHKFRKARVREAEKNEVKRDVRTAGVQYEKDLPQLAALLRRRVMAATREFSSRLAPSISQLEGLQLIRYRPGGFYETHKDNPGGKRTNHREVTVVVYLNDDFRGGATAFTKLQYAFTPRAGYVLLFPSVYKHKAEAVMEGTKYIIAAWYRSDPPEGTPAPSDGESDVAEPL